jgi:hypothetical protein
VLTAVVMKTSVFWDITLCIPLKVNRRFREIYWLTFCGLRLSLWSEFVATDPEVLVRFPALPDFLRTRGSGTGSTQPREYN